MLHPATQAVERYYTLFNEKDWSGIATMFDLPAILIVGPSKILLEHPGAITSLYRGVGERCTREGAVRVSWDRGSLPSSRFTKILPS